jgi:hypothetical protein
MAEVGNVDLGSSGWSERWMMMSTRYFVEMEPQLYIHVHLDSDIG